MKTVIVVRKDHPEGKVLINKCDMKPDDVEFKDAKKQPTKKKGSK